MYKFYDGKVTLHVSTIVEAQKDSEEERNAAHDLVDRKVMNKLMSLIQANGYFCSCVSLDLCQGEDASLEDLEELHLTIEEAKRYV